MTNLSVELVKARLLEADEVKKASVAKLKLRNRQRKEISNPTAGLARSERHDGITQIVQDGKFTADVAPAKGDDNPVPQADFAGTYTEKMPHGMTAGMGKGENEKSPKAVGTTGMTPNQTTKLRQVGPSVKHTEDDGNQDIFQIPQADFAADYVEKMDHGKAGGTTAEDGSDAAPGKRSYDKMAGGPTRAGGKKSANLGGDAVGAKKKDSQKVGQVSGNQGIAKDPSDAPKKASWNKETHGAHNVYEGVQSGVAVSLNGKPKAQFEIVSGKVLQRMAENYAHHGYNVEFSRTQAGWKKDRTFLAYLSESINARYNHAPNTAKVCRKAAMQRFGALCKESYNDLYESRQDFVDAMGDAFRIIESKVEDKYLDGLEFFDGLCRVVIEGEEYDLEVLTHATDKQMAARQIRAKVQEEYGFDADIQHVFVDGEKFAPDAIENFQVMAEIAPAIAAVGRAAAQGAAAQAGANMADKAMGKKDEGRGRKKKKA